MTINSARFLVLSSKNLRPFLNFKSYPEDLEHLQVLGALVVQVVAVEETYDEACKKARQFAKLSDPLDGYEETFTVVRAVTQYSIRITKQLTNRVAVRHLEVEDKYK